MCSAILLIRDASTQTCKYFSYLALEILLTFQLILICWPSLALPQIIIAIFTTKSVSDLKAYLNPRSSSDVSQQI